MEIYLDHAAATPLRKEVEAVMKNFSRKNYANPSSLHQAGEQARRAREDSREKIRKILGASPQDKIIFTSGGTESINLALIGFMSANKNKGNHLITTKIEHPAVLETCKFLENSGFKVTYLPVDDEGYMDLKELEQCITTETMMISVIYAHNEIGTIQRIKEISSIAKKHNLVMHLDACQAAALNLSVDDLGADLLTLNSSKIYGPKGSGLLYVRKGIGLSSLIHGGGQEDGLRGGTENVAAIVGLARALELIQEKKEQENKRQEKLRDNFINEILQILGTKLNGPKERLPNNVNISFIGLEAEEIIRHLSLERIFVSAGSACHSRKIEVSHVLAALGMPEEESRGVVRFTLGIETTEKQLQITVKKLKKIVFSLRDSQS